MGDSFAGLRVGFLGLVGAVSSSRPAFARTLGVAAVKDGRLATALLRGAQRP